MQHVKNKIDESKLDTSSICNDRVKCDVFCDLFDEDFYLLNFIVKILSNRYLIVGECQIVNGTVDRNYYPLISTTRILIEILIRWSWRIKYHLFVEAISRMGRWKWKREEKAMGSIVSALLRRIHNEIERRVARLSSLSR